VTEIKSASKDLPIPIDADSIAWQKIEWEVNRLKTRIAKAEEDGLWNKAKNLRYLLAHSWAGRLYAAKHYEDSNA
jgi:hypothetical protein